MPAVEDKLERVAILIVGFVLKAPPPVKAPVPVTSFVPNAGAVELPAIIPVTCPCAFTVIELGLVYVPTLTPVVLIASVRS